MTKLLKSGLSQLKVLQRRTHKQLKPLQREQSLQMTEQIITAVSQLPILHLPPAPYVSLYHVQFFCSLASFSCIKPSQALNSAERVHGHSWALIQTQPARSPHRLDSLPEVRCVCPVRCALKNPQATLRELILLKHPFLLVRLFGRFPKDGWAQFLVHHAGGLQHPAHMPLFRNAMP